MPSKAFAKLRVGLLDHAGTLGANPDAGVLYLVAHLKAPISGPDKGCVYINQAEWAGELGWSRTRVNRAVRFLQTHPRKHEPWFVQVERGRKGQAGKYYIWNFDGEEVARKSVANLGRRLPGRGSDSVTETHTIGRDSVTELHTNEVDSVRIAHTIGSDCVQDDVHVAHTNAELCAGSCPAGAHNPTFKTRASEEQETRRTRRGSKVFDRSHEEDEHGGWRYVRNEAEARIVLLRERGYENLPEEIRGQALATALANLEQYRIAYLDDPEQPEADADYEDDNADDWRDPFAEVG